MLSKIIDQLYQYALTTPIEFFAFFASLIEEILPPIPAPSVITIVGVVAKIQDYSITDLPSLVIIGALGKTIGAIILYFIVDKLEDVFVLKFGKVFNLDDSKLKEAGRKLGQKKVDYLLLTLLRATPFFPSTLITVGCGLLQVPYKLFITTTFIGSLIRNSIYIYIGFASVNLFHPLLVSFVEISLFIKLIIIIGGIGLFVLWLRRK